MARKLTITLDDDLAVRVEKQAERNGMAPEDFVTDGVRKMVEDVATGTTRGSLIAYAQPMGLRPGLSLENIDALLDEIEGPARR